MVHVYIPRYRLIDELPDKPYYVYIVDVFHCGKQYKVERRYSAFHCLHRELRKNYSTPVFPPKRVRSCQTKVLERRRKCLEEYLQVMLRFGPSRDQVLAFLGINKTQTFEESGEVSTSEKSLSHQPIYIYKKDPFVDYERRSNLPDIVTEVLQNKIVASLPRLLSQAFIMARLKIYQYFLFISVWILYAATYLIRKPLGVIKVGMGEELKFSKTQMGWMDTAIMLPYSVVQMLFGKAADSLGPRRTVTACLALTGMSMLSFGTWNSYPMFLLLLLLSGASQAPAWPACCKCLAAWFPDKTQNTVFGLMSTSAFGGSMIASAIAVYLYSYYGWRLVYLPLSVAVLGLSLVAWISLKMPEDYMITVPGKTVTIEHIGVKTNQSVWDLWRLPMVSELALAMLCLKLVRYCIYLWFPVYLIEGRGLSASSTGLLLVMFDVGGVAGSAFLGYAADRHCSLFHTWLAVVGSTLCFIFFLLTVSWGVMYNAALLLMAGACICGPDSLLGGSVAVSIGERDGRNAGAAVAGLINGFGSLGGVLEGPLVGYVTQMYGWNTVFLLIIGLLSISAFSVLKAFIIQKRQIHLSSIMLLTDAE